MNSTLCPRCGGVKDEYRSGLDFPRLGALSRYDNKTIICSECGTDEALRTWRFDELPREKWFDRSQQTIA